MTNLTVYWQYYIIFVARLVRQVIVENNEK